jgi:hypothetical protein
MRRMKRIASILPILSVISCMFLTCFLLVYPTLDFDHFKGAWTADDVKNYVQRFVLADSMGQELYYSFRVVYPAKNSNALIEVWCIVIEPPVPMDKESAVQISHYIFSRSSWGKHLSKENHLQMWREAGCGDW